MKKDFNLLLINQSHGNRILKEVIWLQRPDFNCGPTQNALLYTVVPDLCLQKLTKISWNCQIDEFFWSQMFSLVTLIAEIYVKTSYVSIFPKLHWFDEIFREIAGNSAPELPEFDRKSQKFRQFGVFTKFLSLFQKRHSVNTVLRIAIWVGPRLKTDLHIDSCLALIWKLIMVSRHLAFMQHFAIINWQEKKSNFIKIPNPNGIQWKRTPKVP